MIVRFYELEEGMRFKRVSKFIRKKVISWDTDWDSFDINFEELTGLKLKADDAQQDSEEE